MLQIGVAENFWTTRASNIRVEHRAALPNVATDQQDHGYIVPTYSLFMIPFHQSSRREFLRYASALAVAGPLAARLAFAADNATEEKLPPVRAVTRGPRFHW